MRGLTALLIAAAAVAAVGCQESGFDEARETSRPLKVQHALGEAKVPGQAKRPVTLTVDALDDSLALGVRPVRAAVPGGRVPAYLDQRAPGVAVVDSVTASDVGALKPADPDVILGSASGQGRLYDNLREVAPTVLSDGGSVAWKLTARLYGEALGRTNDAERLLIDYDRGAARLRDRLGPRRAQTEVSVVRVGRRAVWIAGEQSFSGSVIGDVGLSQPPAQSGRREYERVGWNRLAALDGDVMLLSVAAGGERQLRQLRTRPGWGDLGAVRAGRVVRVDDGVWWSGGGFLAARAAQRDLERAASA